MRFLPSSRKVELENSKPEKVINAFPGTYFYRVGNDKFYLIRKGKYQRIEVRKRSLALDYRRQLWFPRAKDSDIVFAQPYELWVKRGAGLNAIGWSFVSFKTVGLSALTPTENIYYVDGGDAYGNGPVYGDIILDGGNASSVF